MLQPNEGIIGVHISLDSEEHHILIIQPEAAVFKIDLTLDGKKHHVLITAPNSFSPAEILSAVRTHLVRYPAIGSAVEAVLKEIARIADRKGDYNHLFPWPRPMEGRWWPN